MNTVSDKHRNVAAAVRLVREAASRGAEWIMLPEMFPYMGKYKEIFSQSEEEGGPLHQTLSKLARELNIILFAGSMGERPSGGGPGDKIYNTQYVFGRDGKQLAKYRKTHLFNLLDDQGKSVYCESNGYIPGDRLVSVDIEGYHVALVTCYDLRFPEMFAKFHKLSGAIDVIAAPSAFTYQTGQHHWEVLLRARAIENLSFVFAANQTGEHIVGKRSYGHSMIVDPWGEVLANTGDAEGIAMAPMSLKRIKEYRQRLPVLVNRRPELY